MYPAARVKHLGHFNYVEDKIVRGCMQIKIQQASSWTFGSLEGLLTNNSHTSDL